MSLPLTFFRKKLYFISAHLYTRCRKDSLRQLCGNSKPTSNIFKHTDEKLTVVHTIVGRGMPAQILLYSGHLVKSYTCTKSYRQLSTTIPKTKKEKVTVTFIKKDGTRLVADGKEGDSLYDIVINNQLDIDGYGACEGTASCSTCHLILKEEDYEKLKDKPSDEEQDLLDLAFDLTDTSRLGCMVYMTKEMNGLEVYVPEGINDVRAI